MVTSAPLWLWCERLPPCHIPPMTAISSCKMVRPSASNNLQSKQTWRSLTFIETSDPVHRFHFSSLCSVFTDRQVLRFRFNNEEKFLLGPLLLVLAAPGPATDGWLELITLNGENIIWPHRFSPRGCAPPHRHRQTECFTGWARGQEPRRGSSLLHTRQGVSLLNETWNSGLSFKYKPEKLKSTEWHPGPGKHTLADRIALKGSSQLPERCTLFLFRKEQ